MSDHKFGCAFPLRLQICPETQFQSYQAEQAIHCIWYGHMTMPVGWQTERLWSMSYSGSNPLQKYVCPVLRTE